MFLDAAVYGLISIGVFTLASLAYMFYRLPRS
jgi:hypothetical protein